MICSRCNGKGYQIYTYRGYIADIVKCQMCHGTGEVEQTNEEWLCGLSTDKKAEALHNLHWEIQNYRDDHPSIEDDDVSLFYLDWLKAVHEE